MAAVPLAWFPPVIDHLVSCLLPSSLPAALHLRMPFLHPSLPHPLPPPDLLLVCLN